MALGKATNKWKSKMMLGMDRIPRLRIFVAALVAVIGVVATLLWINANHQEKKSSIPTQFEAAASAYHAHDYEFAADIMRPIAEAGDVNAQVNLGLALYWIRVKKALSKDKESGAPNIDEEFKWWCLAAIQGDPDAQNWLSIGTYNENKSEAAYWRKLAAENGEPEAQESLAWHYHFGTGVLRDDKKALQLLHAAAEQGNDSAQLELGDIYFDGKGNSDPPWTQVRQNYADAAKWYLAAAQQGNSIAQGKVGLMYHLGLGVVQDFAQAYFWLSLAAADPIANMGSPYLNSDRKMRDEAASRLTTERLNRTQELLAKWRAPERRGIDPPWRKNPAPQRGDKQRLADLFDGSVCTRWNSQTRPR